MKKKKKGAKGLQIVNNNPPVGVGEHAAVKVDA